jgi:cell shape-determining protein MreD
MKRQIPLALVFVFGWLMLALYFIPLEGAQKINENLLDWTSIIGIFALALGIWSLITVNVDRIKYKKRDWQYSFITLFGLFGMIIFGLKFGGETSVFQGQESYMFRHFFNDILIPIYSTMFSLLAFFIASAAYRAFRARSALASILLIGAIIVMIRFFPFVAEYTRPVADWILNVPNLAAKRAIWMGVGLGIVATGLKVILGIERAYLGRD